MSEEPAAPAPQSATPPAPESEPAPETARPRAQWGRLVATSVLVFAVALVVRLVVLSQVAEAPSMKELRGDARGYDAWAQRIAAGEWVGGETFYQPPLYPYVLAIIYRIAGRDLRGVRIVQAVLGSLACVLVFLGARRFFSSWTIGIVAGLLMGLYPPAIFFDVQIEKTVLDAVLVAALLVQVATLLDNQRTWRWAAVGVTCGLLALTRENALALWVLTAIWMLVHFRSLGGAVLMRWSLALFAGLAVVLLPVAMRNFAVGGEFHLTTAQFGPNFYIGNNATADGLYRPLRPGRGDVMYERIDATRLAEQDVGRSLTAGEVSSYWTSRAMSDIGADPLRWVMLLARKWLLVWSSTEIADSGDYDTIVAWSRLLQRFERFWHFGVLLPLVAAGAVLTWKQFWRRTWVLYLLIIGYSAAVAAFYLFARYRYPLVPMLMPLAAAGVVLGIGRLARGGFAIVGVAFAAAVVVAIVSNGTWVIPTRLKGVDHYNRAVAQASLGNTDSAIVMYGRALRANPRLVDAHNNLGMLLADQSRLDDAITHYRAARDVKPDDAAIENNLAIALWRSGRTDESIVHFQNALRVDPQMWAARYNLGVALAQRGRIDDAADQLRQLVQQQPDHANGHERLGELLIGLRQDASAVAHLRRALELHDRANPQTLSRLAWLRATSFEPSVRNGEEAVKLAESALRASRAPTPALLDVLAAAHAEAGKFDEAVRVATRAQEMAEVRRENVLAGGIAERLEHYKAGRPFHHDPPPTTAATKPSK